VGKTSCCNATKDQLQGTRQLYSDNNDIGATMLTELSGVCQHCSTAVRVLMRDGALIGTCSSCDQEPFDTKPIPGVIYIVSNPNQLGVKIGMTNKSIDARLRSLSGTGVPGEFQLIAMFPSKRPKADEQKVHFKLKRKRIHKEHFNVEPVDAVLAAYRALNKRVPIFDDAGIEENFWLRLEQDRINTARKLRGNR
jgi:hypothetical protein